MNNVIIHQGETKVFDLLAVYDDLNFSVASLTEVNAATHTHEIELKDSCQIFTVGENIYIDFEGINSCHTGCYEVKFVDGCGTIIGFDAEDCLNEQSGVEIIPTCCGGVITKTNSIATAYKPINLKVCDSIYSHVRVVSSALIRKPPFVGSYQQGTNVFLTKRLNKPNVKVGAYVSIDGREFVICSVEDRGKNNIAITVDGEFTENSYSAKMVYNPEPIAILTGGYEQYFCQTCGSVRLSLSKEDSMKLLPGVKYHWDVMANTSAGVQRLGGGTLELQETFSY